MIYKIIEDKKWEYKVVKIKYYDLVRNQMDSICEGYEGWEAYAVQKIDVDKYLIFLKRSYVEKINN